MTRRPTTLLAVLALAAPLVVWSPGDVAVATSRTEAVIRWEPTSTQAERDAVLAEVGAVRTGRLSTVHDVDVVAAMEGSEHDIELHHEVVKRRLEVAEREWELEEARALAAAALADLDVALVSGDEDAIDDARKDVEDALDDEAHAQEHLEKKLADLAEKRRKHGDEIVKALDGEDHVVWVEERVDTSLGDDRFHAWPEGLSADRFHAWPSGQPMQVADGSSADPELLAVHEHATGAGVTVAVLDTGASRSVGVGETGYDFVDDDADPRDERDGVDNDGDGLTDEAHGHGGVVADVVRAVAPDAHVLQYRVLDADGLGEPHAMALAIEDAVARGADVINISAGTDTRYASHVLRDAFKDAEDAGVLVVAAAGNAGSDGKHYPAAEKDVIAVAALGHGGALARFSNRGTWATLAAPGVDIAGLLPDGSPVLWSGSSFAAPRVSGQFALLREHRPELEAKDLRKMVRDTGRKLDGASSRAVSLLDSLERD